MKRSGPEEAKGGSPDGAPSSQKKAKRDDDEKEGSQINSSWLPMELVLRVSSFLDIKGLTSLTLTSKGCRDVVELLCEKRLEEKLDLHQPMDLDFFLDRLRDQSSIETSRKRPFDLPWRYFLWRALPRTCLSRLQPIRTHRASLSKWHAHPRISLFTKMKALLTFLVEH